MRAFRNMSSAQRRLLTTLQELRESIASRCRPGWRFSSLYELVLEHGLFFGPHAKLKTVHWGVPKHCFGNAFDLVLDDPRLYYVEGYAMAGGLIPTLHAWAVTGCSRVVDNTWREQGTCRLPVADRAYFGIPLQRNYVKRVVKENRKTGILDAWEAGWPLLTGTHRIEDVVQLFA